MDVVGVDGSREGWVALRLSNGSFAEVRIFPNFNGLVNQFDSPAVIAVDIPIGLPPEGRRQADVEARRVLGPRGNSVFFVPPRQVLEAENFQEAARRARFVNSSVNQQIFALRERIFEVEKALANRAGTTPSIVEVHPEVSFWAMNGRQPLRFPKRTWNGLVERLELLRAGGIDLPLKVNDVGEAGPDDVIDAAAAAWSAWRFANNEAQSLPEGKDAHAPMTIWF